MIERFLEKLIEELGATGLLVVGLYLMLYRPLTSMAHSLKKINAEIGSIINLMQGKKPNTEDPHG